MLKSKLKKLYLATLIAVLQVLLGSTTAILAITSEENSFCNGNENSGYWDYVLPTRIKVLPVFLVPTDKGTPTNDELIKFRDHIRWAQRRYKEMLDDRDTFELAAELPFIVPSKYNSSFYTGKWKNDDIIAQELLDHYGYNRFNNPYIYVAIIYQTSGSTGGRCFNGGFNTGGGYVIFRNPSGLNSANFQSTLRHELGHTFGFTHVDDAGYPAIARYSQDSSQSIMSYNKAHLTNGFSESPTPGILLPEDIRDLSLNKRAFPNLFFDPEQDIPDGIKIYRRKYNLGIMSIPGHMSGELKVRTDYSEMDGTSVENVVQNQIRERDCWDAATMWHSGKVNELGWVSLEIEFPYEATLNGLGIYSQHSSKYHAAEKVQVEYYDGNRFTYVIREIVAPDDEISFPTTMAKKWRFAFYSSDDYVVIRGLRFFIPMLAFFPVPYYREIFPQEYPIEQHNYPLVRTEYGEEYDSKVHYVVRGKILKSSPEVGFDRTTMWHSGPVNSPGWVSLEVYFPYPVSLNGLGIHSQHSGKYHAADKVQVEYVKDNRFTYLTRQDVSIDEKINFSTIKAQYWRFAFHSISDYVVIRGLQFYTPWGEIFAPYYIQNDSQILAKDHGELDQHEKLPAKYGLSQNYPNPFNPETQISYQLPEASHVTIQIYNLLGQKIITLVDDKQPAGVFNVTWNSKDAFGMDVPSSTYLCRMSAVGDNSRKQFTASRKLLLLR